MEKNQRASKSSPDLSRTARIKVQDAKQRNKQTPQSMRGACLPFRLIFKNCGPQKQEPNEKLEALQESATPLIKLSVEHRIVGERLLVRTLHKPVKIARKVHLLTNNTA
jgi:hypothetical protein